MPSVDPGNGQRPARGRAPECGRRTVARSGAMAVRVPGRTASRRGCVGRAAARSFPGSSVRVLVAPRVLRRVARERDARRMWVSTRRRPSPARERRPYVGWPRRRRDRKDEARYDHSCGCLSIRRVHLGIAGGVTGGRGVGPAGHILMRVPALPRVSGSHTVGYLDHGPYVTADDAQDESVTDIRIAKQRSDPPQPGWLDPATPPWIGSHTRPYAQGQPKLTPTLRLFSNLT
jgi:hypothetical protein